MRVETYNECSHAANKRIAKRSCLLLPFYLIETAYGYN